MRSAHHYHDRYRRGGSVCVSNAEVAIDTAGVASYSYLFFLASLQLSHAEVNYSYSAPHMDSQPSF